MLRNYLTVTFRNLWRNKQYTLVNILGIGIGMATMVWAFQNYRFSHSYDQMHKDRDNIFRVDIYREGSDVLRGICPMPVALSAKEDFASVEEVLRMERMSIAVKGEGNEPSFERVNFVDQSFFELFDFPMIIGSNDISDKNGVVITDAKAEKYFGASKGDYGEVIGKTMEFYSGTPQQMRLTIKGVIKENPLNSSIRFGFLTHINNLYDRKGEQVKDDNWHYLLDVVFLKLKNPEDAPRLAREFKKYIGPQNAAREDWKVTGFVLEPLSKVADHDNDLWNNALLQRPPDSATNGPVVLAILIFLVCCLNFANTTVARSNRRLKEMGVRKVMGGTQRQLIFQMLLEYGFIVFLGVFVAVMVNEYWLPYYNRMWTYLDLKTDYFHDHQLMLFMGAMVLLTTLLAGAYPAFYLSRFNPTSIFRGGIKFGGSNLFSRVLLGLQVVISLMTVISGVAFSRNSEFQKTFDYGFEKDNVLFVNVRDKKDFHAYRDAVAKLPDVVSSAGSIHHMGYSYWRRGMEAEGEKKEAIFMEVGENYLETMSLKVIDGRPFDPEMGTDYESSVLVNEQFAALYGWDPAGTVGKRINMDTLHFNVVGLLKDFYVNSLYSELEPIAMHLTEPEKQRLVVLKVAPGKLNSVMDQAKATWEKMYPFKPFDGHFQDEMTADAQRTTDNVAQIFFWFAIISVLLTSIGLFALVSQTVMKKMKEIAVRKVVGASPRHIMYLINKGYFWIFIVAAIIGCYAGWYSTKQLMDMIFRVNVGVTTNTLVVSSITIFIIAFATVGIKVWDAVRINPAEILKNE
ncbi:MAG TPA: FtsX-like permease family protein [Bacteroidetes bacterium]|nr:FtsX-like permease family protein [Bacteroidota bacterium]